MSKRIDRKMAKTIAKEHGYLQYMIERYLALWGESETLRFIQACEYPVRTSIRANTLKTSIDEFQERLQKRGVNLESVPWLEEGFFADFSRHTPGSLFEHMMGHYYVQGVPSMTVVRALDPQPGEIVFDLASAPGGKTTHIAQRMENSGLVISIESDRQRINSLESNILRCGVTNSLILRGDVRKLDQLEIIPDKILLDAPCSGEGLIALDPSRKTSKTMADIRYCATRQDEMIEAALNMLPTGGTLVYSTCSIAPEENEFVIDELLRKRDDFKVIPIELDFGIPAYTDPYGVQLHKSLELARRFLPQKHGLEGFFIIRMTKEEVT
ncbi:MAG: RsmB/NOP family class I SAM-dependent RNA methyltransferase [Candidatus Thorarchaeota archaeon]